jgi:hypothetical protein
MRQTPFDLAKSVLKVGILLAALGFQMLPFFLLLVVFAFAMGVTGGGMLGIIPVLFFAMVFAASWLASKRSRLVHAGPTRLPSPWAWRPKRRQREPVILLKTRAERYWDLKDILSNNWR